MTLQAMVVILDYNKWKESKIEEEKKIRLQILENDWWVDCAYLVSLLCFIVEVIRYIDTNCLRLGEIYETFDSMLGFVKVVIREKNLSLEFYMTYILPII